MEKLSDDVLKGVPAIAEYLGETKRRTYYLLEKTRFPASKLGVFGTVGNPSLTAITPGPPREREPDASSR